MKRTYYHNKHEKSTVNVALYKCPDKVFDFDDHCKYIRHPFVVKKISSAHASSKVSVNNLNAILISIGQSSHNYISTARQADMAKNAHISLRTFRTGLYALRKRGLIVTKHRYTGDKKTRRRTTSLTVLKAFADFCVMAKNKIISTVSDKKSLIGRISSTLSGYHQVDTEIINRETGEINTFYGS
jgi:hypothetical protein